MQVVLVMLRADGSRRSFPITKPMTVIGRRGDCDFRVPLPSVSRRHCRLVKDEQYVRVEDLGSSNGTRVNGERVELAVLSPGDVLGVGPVKFAIQIDGQPVIAEQVGPAKASGSAVREVRETGPAAVGAGMLDDEIDRILAAPSSTPGDSGAPVDLSSPADSSAEDVMIDFGRDDRQR